MKYDVVVVGSGPAGSVTAGYAAKAGANVLILERRTEVGVPVLCGEGISKNVDNFEMLKGTTRWIANKMDGARIYSPDGTRVTLAAERAGNETGYVTYRDIFDQTLAQTAMKWGAELQLNTNVTGLLMEKGRIAGVTAQHFDEKIEINADIIVGADGVESRVGRWAGIKTTLKPIDLETCAQYMLTNVDVEKEFCHFYVGKKYAPGGYVWIFPKAKDVANVGIGVLASLSESGLALRLLDTFIASHPGLKHGQPLRLLAGADPVAEPVESVRDHLVLVGDAARQVDPITGGGLTMSLEGGKIAGEVIGNAVNQHRFDRDFLSEYERRWQSAYARKLKRNYMVKEIFLGFDDKTLNMLADSLKDYNFNEINTLGLVKALVAKHPTLLMKLSPLLKLSTV
ncbi:MAG: NAD(P)/FAD-dependent oxidoreductase [Methanobacteriota archaeon]